MFIGHPAYNLVYVLLGGLLVWEAYRRIRRRPIRRWTRADLWFPVYLYLLWRAPAFDRNELADGFVALVLFLVSLRLLQSRSGGPRAVPRGS